MTHDPLCPYQPERSTNCEMKSGVMCAVMHYTPPVPCQCSLIAKVRADELRRPSEDGWMSVRAVLAWEDQVRADERDKVTNYLRGKK